MENPCLAVLLGSGEHTTQAVLLPSFLGILQGPSRFYRQTLALHCHSTAMCHLLSHGEIQKRVFLHAPQQAKVWPPSALPFDFRWEIQERQGYTTHVDQSKWLWQVLCPQYLKVLLKYGEEHSLIYAWVWWIHLLFLWKPLCTLFSLAVLDRLRMVNMITAVLS